MSRNLRSVMSLLCFAGLGVQGPALGQGPGDTWTEAALTFVRWLQDGQFDSAAATVSDAIPAGALEAQQLERIWTGLLASSGPLVGIEPQHVVEQGTLRIVDLAAR